MVARMNEEEADVGQDSQIGGPVVTGGVTEDAFEVLEDALYQLWSTANELARIRPPKPKYFRVTIFGSSRIRPGDDIYDEVRHLAADLSSMGCDIVTGGGPGLMQAANEGAKLGDPDNRTRSFGLPIELPSREEEPNPFVEKLYHHRTFFTRLHHFVRLSSAFIVVRGGIGTMLETALIWQLCQVQHVNDIPLIFIGDMWKELVEWGKHHMLGSTPELAGAADLDIPHCVPGVAEACALVAARKAIFDEKGVEV
ncbi:MAG: LOG family protein [Gemmatimonadota bacterium]|nr:LOG family protein [Gemmatimonadota bacterium]